MSRWDDAHEETGGPLLQVIDRLDAGNSLTIQDVVDMCGVDAACARRYIRFAERHRELAVRREGGHKEWFKVQDPGARDNEAVHRAVALDFAVAALAELEGTPHLDALRAAADRERNGLAAPARDRADRIARTFHPLRPEVSGSAERPSTLGLLSKAIERRHRVWMRYLPLRGDMAEYTIEPGSFVLHKGRLMLIAGKLEGQRVRRRTFNVDGIQELRETGEKNQGSAHRVDHERTFRDSFGVYTDVGAAEGIHLRVRGSHAIAFRQRAVHHSQQLTDGDGGWTDLRLHLVVCPEFRAFVVGLIPDVQVVAPTHLLHDMRARVTEWLRAPS